MENHTSVPSEAIRRREKISLVSRPISGIDAHCGFIQQILEVKPSRFLVFGHFWGLDRQTVINRVHSSQTKIGRRTPFVPHASFTVDRSQHFLEFADVREIRAVGQQFSPIQFNQITYSMVNTEGGTGIYSRFRPLDNFDRFVRSERVKTDQAIGLAVNVVSARLFRITAPATPHFAN